VKDKCCLVSCDCLVVDTLVCIVECAVIREGKIDGRQNHMTSYHSMHVVRRCNGLEVAGISR
jgi:hypothetical protein